MRRLTARALAGMGQMDEASHPTRVIWERNALDKAALAPLDAVFATGGKPGARLALSDDLRAALRPVDAVIRRARPGMVAVRAVAFDKTAAANWALPWHQDRVIAVQDRHDVPGFANWSRKHGVWHCEPPEALLAQMLFLRVHLDDAGADEGAMEIALGSDAAGLVAADQAESVAKAYPAEVCVAQRGDVLVLPMLTLHRSLAATRTAARRVLRIDYAAFDLPAPLAWAD